METCFQFAPLVAPPSYPNSISWSEENLVAIASGNLITILNPSSLLGPRGVITLPPNKPFPIGVVREEDLVAPCLLPITLNRESSPCARSISWSPIGFAPNSGCLLAVCTTEGRVSLYRPPVCDLCAEWVEIMDISDALCNYIESNNFGELNVPSATFPQEQNSVGCIEEIACNDSWCTTARNVHLEDSVSAEVNKFGKRKKRTRFEDCEDTNPQKQISNVYRDVFHQASNRDKNGELELPKANDKAVDVSSVNLLGNTISGDFFSKFKGNASASIREDHVLPLINARQYASRSALLSSLIVAWSPVFQLSQSCPPNCHSRNYVILAVGGKSGNISFWRCSEPECYSIEEGISVGTVLFGLLHAHNSWITAISWGICDRSSSGFQLVLASGSSDGSVKVWVVDAKGLMKSSEVDGAPPFSLFKEVTAVTYIPISTISLLVPVQSSDKVVMSIGKGSGSLEVWVCQISSSKLESAGVYNAHEEVVTGLTWAFGGHCLYSCSQDNTLRSWNFDGNYLYGTPFSSKYPGQKNSLNQSEKTDQYLGLAISPGDLIIAAVRSCDASLLNPMYQARTQRALVEFFWIGGQPLALPSDKHLDCDVEDIPGFTARDLIFWESNILWSLKSYTSLDKVLLLWDVITALAAFKKFSDMFVENVLAKWISSWFSDVQSDVSIGTVLYQVQNMMSKISTRKMHLLNIICRRLMLGEVKENESNEQKQRPSGFNTVKQGNLGLWDKLLMNSERELQQRLVAFIFRKSCVPYSATGPTFCMSQSPVGVAQMRTWVLTNSELVHEQLKLLAFGVGEHGSRAHSLLDAEVFETCSFCSAKVPFESADVAWCEGIKSLDGSFERHRLVRCAVSMLLGSVVAPMWFCVCCQRSAANLPPQTFFTMSKSPLDLDCQKEVLTFEEGERSRPLCPFCGILLQRLLPDFLLSASPV